MSYTITGKVLAIGQPQQIPSSKDPSRPFIKRELTLDCTRYDPFTGQRSPYENTPMLEFTGDICGELNQIKEGDVVTVTFEVQGTRYTDRNTQQTRIFTRIRPYKIVKGDSFSQPAIPQHQGQDPLYPRQAQPQGMTYDPLSQSYQQAAQPIQATPQQQQLFPDGPPF